MTQIWLHRFIFFFHSFTTQKPKLLLTVFYYRVWEDRYERTANRLTGCKEPGCTQLSQVWGRNSLSGKEHLHMPRGTEVHRRTETCSLLGQSPPTLLLAVSHHANDACTGRVKPWPSKAEQEQFYIFLHCHIHEISQLINLNNAPQLKVWILSSSRQVTLAAYVQSEVTQKAWHPLSGAVWLRGKGPGSAVIQTMSWTVAPLLKSIVTSSSAEGMRWFRSVA